MVCHDAAWLCRVQREAVLVRGDLQAQRLLCTVVLAYSSLKKRKEKKSYAGSKTLPALVKEKETHWPKVP